MPVTKEDWKAYKSRPIDPDSWEWEVSCGNIVVASRLNKANANIIVAAVNACKVINPDNPIAVAESIKDTHETLKAIVDKRMECHETEAAYIPPEMELAYKVLARALER